MRRLVTLLLALLAAPPLLAEDRLEMEGIEIIGNSELPRALYIVPWQQPEQKASTGKPVDSLTNELLQPLEREAFLRRLKYFEGGGN
jgi:hypothetical protein